MSHRRLAVLGVVVGVIALWLVSVVAQTQGGTVPRTPWGAPDLQGIWDDVVVTPFERPKEYGTREFLTEQERAAQAQALAKQVAEFTGPEGVNAGQRDLKRKNVPDYSAERDVAGAYNAIWQGVPDAQVGKRTSVVIDPPDGRIPSMTPEGAKRVATYREFQLALLQATDTCKRQLTACRDGKYGPPSLRRAELPPVYNFERINRSDGPEDNSWSTRCLGNTLPQIGTMQRIVQSPDAVTIFYDIGQGQGFSRLIPINSTPHLPPAVRQQYGDARGRWEGDTLVVDVTNFTHKTDFRGSRQNLHLIERYTRTNANTLTYQITVDDPTTWTKPWTAIVELSRQDERANQIYQQTCHEGNYGLTGIMANFRAVDKAFAEGKGPDPAFQDNASPGGGED